MLAEYEPEEIVALLSAFVFQEKTAVEPTLTASLERGVAKIVEISEKVNQIQTLHQVILSADDSNDFVSKPRFGMVEVVYEWARGMSFNRITDLTDVMEGTIVRVITRLDETCREVKNAARIIGDPTLFQKMGTCQELIKRYVVIRPELPVYDWWNTTNTLGQGHLQLCKLVLVATRVGTDVQPEVKKGRRTRMMTFDLLCDSHPLIVRLPALSKSTVSSLEEFCDGCQLSLHLILIR